MLLSNRGEIEMNLKVFREYMNKCKAEHTEPSFEGLKQYILMEVK